MCYDYQTVIVEPVCIRAVQDRGEGEVLEVATPISQGPEGLGAGGKLIAPVGKGSQVRAVDTGQPESTGGGGRGEGEWRVWIIMDTPMGEG